ncbi:MAG: hypothetical protein IKE52_02735 [Mogibacterium sp.]|nr:hypothetical protein [Mogibacterium sp.]
MNSGKYRYYITSKRGEKKVRKTLKEDDVRLRQLARKEYIRRSLKEIEDNLGVLESSLLKIHDIDPNDILQSMPKTYRDLPQDFFFNRGKEATLLHLSDETAERCARHRAWAEESYERSSYKMDNLKFLSSAGVKVRSKSELLIVETLDRFGVPFRYEQVIFVGRRRLTPDFTFQDYNGKLFFWEHAGMMDNEEYRVAHNRKMSQYEDAGIAPWDNLIVTYDVNGIINTPMIRSIIEYDVIPRL